MQPRDRIATKRMKGGGHTGIRILHLGIERTLLDGLSMPQYCGDFAEVLHAFEIGMAQLDIERITEYALRLDAATAKPLGWVLESKGVDASQVDRLTALPIKGYRKLDSAGPKKGRYNSRWMWSKRIYREGSAHEAS